MNSSMSSQAFFVIKRVCIKLVIIQGNQTLDYGKTPLLRPLEIKTTPLLRPAFVSSNCFLFYYGMSYNFGHQDSDKMADANSVDPDQTAPSGSILFTFPISI